MQDLPISPIFVVFFITIFSHSSTKTVIRVLWFECIMVPIGSYLNFWSPAENTMQRSVAKRWNLSGWSGSLEVDLKDTLEVHSQLSGVYVMWLTSLMLLPPRVTILSQWWATSFWTVGWEKPFLLKWLEVIRATEE